MMIPTYIQKICERNTQLKISIFSVLTLACINFCVLSPAHAKAAQNGDSSKVTFHGTLRVKDSSCSIGGSNPIQVEYGDVYIGDISGDTYRKPLNYDVTCKGDLDGKSIQLQLIGIEAVFGNGLLKTDANGLGIKILRNGSQMTLNHWYDLDPANKPTLEGVLVKKSEAHFTNGQEFNASATLEVAYN